MVNYNYTSQGTHIGNRGILKISGAGSIKAIPDTATLNLGIVTEDLSLKTAQAQNAAMANEVVKLLNSLGISNKQIRTSSYTIEPIYEYVDQKQIFKGYRVTNILSVTIKNLEEIGNIIDKAVATGVNRIDAIHFTVSNPSQYYNKALNLAIEDAIEKAFEVGNKLNVKVEEIPLKITEDTLNVPYAEAPQFKMTMSSTPILPGQIDITAKIRAIFEYS